MHSSDTLLIIDSIMPWVHSYPKPGAARCVQIDMKANRIGLRYLADVGLVGDTASTLRALLPMLRKKDDAFLRESSARVTSGTGCSIRSR